PCRFWQFRSARPAAGGGGGPRRWPMSCGMPVPGSLRRLARLARLARLGRWGRRRTRPPAHPAPCSTGCPAWLRGRARYGLLVAAEEMAAQLNSVTDDQWARPGTRSNGSQFSIETLGLYELHDSIHHLWDVTDV